MTQEQRVKRIEQLQRKIARLLSDVRSDVKIAREHTPGSPMHYYLTEGIRAKRGSIHHSRARLRVLMGGGVECHCGYFGEPNRVHYPGDDPENGPAHRPYPYGRLSLYNVIPTVLYPNGMVRRERGLL